MSNTAEKIETGAERIKRENAEKYAAMSFGQKIKHNVLAALGILFLLGIAIPFIYVNAIELWTYVVGFATILFTNEHPITRLIFVGMIAYIVGRAHGRQNR